MDSQAIAEADQQLYARHQADARPNALYDADGQRRPLSPTDPGQTALRTEWCGLYQASAAVRQPAMPPAHAQGGASDPDRPVNSAVQRCANCHEIEIRLVPAADKSPPDWWPRQTASVAYGNEKYGLVGVCGPRSGALDGNGTVLVTSIPAGACTVIFSDFYRTIESELKP